MTTKDILKEAFDSDLEVLNLTEKWTTDLFKRIAYLTGILLEKGLITKEELDYILKIEREEEHE